MTETVYSWMRNLVCYYLVYSIVMNLVPQKQYQMYIKNFMGMLLVVIILTPVLQFFHSERDLQEFFQTEEMKVAWEEARRTEVVFTQESDEYLLYACREEIKGQIKEMLGDYGLYPADIEVTLKQGEMIEVENIYIQAVSQEESGRISVGEIKIDPEHEKQDPAAEEIRKRLADVYQIDAAHISISIG